MKFISNVYMARGRVVLARVGTGHYGSQQVLAIRTLDFDISEEDYRTNLVITHPDELHQVQRMVRNTIILRCLTPLAHMQHFIR